ncbi:MAG TPA: EamA family transporter [Eubacteriaceae bacterium]|nr:EamA family transporter [Eubacteriaceae bacterium]
MNLVSIGFVLLAAVCWGISGGIADILMTKGWNPIVISFYRGAIGFLCFFIWFLIHFKRNRTFSIRVYLWSFLAGMGVAGNFTLYFLSIEASSIPVAATLMYTAPVFVLLVSIFFGFERFTLLKGSCILSVFVGIVLLTGAYNADALSANFIGITTGLASGLSYALFIFAFKNTALMAKPQTTLTMAFFSFSVLLFLLSDKNEVLAAASSADLGWFLLLGLLGAGISFVFYVVGLRKTSPTVASMIAMIEPVTASLFGVFILQNHLTLVQLIGMLLILLTVTTLAVKQSGKEGS